MANQKPSVVNDNQDKNIGQRGNDKPDGDKTQDSRGAAVRAPGNKVHGDKLEGLIGSSSASERDNGRPTRDDGDNDDLGELDDTEIGKRH